MITKTWLQSILNKKSSKRREKVFNILGITVHAEEGVKEEKRLYSSGVWVRKAEV